MAVILSDRVEVRRGGKWHLLGRADRSFRAAQAMGRAVRSAGQILMFGAFGICGALTGALVVPLSFLLVRDPARRVRIVRRVVYRTCHAFVRTLHRLRLIHLETVGLNDPWKPGSLIVANHPSLLDALILLGYVDGGVVVAKRSLQLNPFTSGSIYGANYVVNGNAPLLVRECLSRIAAGESLVLFPECTRTAEDGVIRLQRGAAQIAARAGCPVVPVTIQCSEPLLTKQSRWWLAPRVRPHVRVVRHEPIDPSQFRVGDPSVTLAARRLNEHLQALYTKELTGRGPA